MKITYPIFSLLILLVQSSLRGFSQEPVPSALPEINFAKVNMYQGAIYTPPQARDGKNGDARFTIVLIRSAKHGKDGRNGKPGPELNVKISALLSGDSTILKLTVVDKSNGKIADDYFVNPRYGAIMVEANGGKGGNGGKGEDGLPKDGKRSATDGGNGGNGGQGGAGGIINVTIDSSALAFVNCKCILYANRGGEGGASGSGGMSNENTNRGSDGEPGRNGIDGPSVQIIGLNGKIIGIR